jgi:hypothetical protein
MIGIVAPSPNRSVGGHVAPQWISRCVRMLHLLAADRQQCFCCGRKNASLDFNEVSGFKGVSRTGMLTFLRKCGGAFFCPLRLASL